MRTPHRPRYSPSAVRTLYAVVLGLIGALGLPLRGTTWAQPVGAEFQVNTYTTNRQYRQAVAADADGDFVVVWQSNQDGSVNGVFGQRYTSAGAAAGAEFQVNTYTFSQQYRPAVAADGDGDFVVVWESNTQDGSGFGVFGQRYTSAGAAVGAEFQVNTYTANAQRFPAVAADADGDFVVVWESYITQDGSGAGVFGQRYTSAGAAVGAEFQVNTYTTSHQSRPAVAADADGDFVVVWDSNYQDGSNVGVFGKRYTSAGAAVGAEFQVNTYTTSGQRFPAVAADADGDFVVAWNSYTQDGSLNGVFGQRYTSAGAAVGAEFQVNTYTTNYQQYPAVAADADGDFVVVWHSNTQVGTSVDVFGKRYTSAGAAVGAEFQVNTYTTGLQRGPAVAADTDGDFVVVWESYQDGSYQGVFGQRFQPIVPPSTTTTTTTSTTTTSTTSTTTTSTTTTSTSPPTTTTTSTTSTTTPTTTSTTLPPPIPALSSPGGLLLGALLMLPMVWGFRRRGVGSSASSGE